MKANSPEGKIVSLLNKWRPVIYSRGGLLGSRLGAIAHFLDPALKTISG